jgi:2-dehydropantoate 2-reductase
MAEAKAIAKARGVTLADDPWEMNVKAVSQGTTDGEDYAHIPSMLDDTRNKQLTEIDWITGSIVREAKKAGVPAPYHETMYRLVKAYETSWSLTESGH